MIFSAGQQMERHSPSTSKKNLNRSFYQSASIFSSSLVFFESCIVGVSARARLMLPAITGLTPTLPSPEVIQRAAWISPLALTLLELLLRKRNTFVSWQLLREKNVLILSQVFKSLTCFSCHSSASKNFFLNFRTVVLFLKLQLHLH